LFILFRFAEQDEQYKRVVPRGRKNTQRRFAAAFSGWPCGFKRRSRLARGFGARCHERKLLTVVDCLNGISIAG